MERDPGVRETGNDTEGPSPSFCEDCTSVIKHSPLYFAEFVFLKTEMSSKKMSKYEKIRQDRIAEREEEWQKLLGSKKEFDREIEKQSKKRANKQAVDSYSVLRRSSRMKPIINYKEDSTTGS